MPAEWENAEAVLIAWPHPSTDWADMLPEIEECYGHIAAAAATAAHVLIICPDPERPLRHLARVSPDDYTIIPLETNDTWTRDYGPITTMHCGAPLPLDFQFNAWGLKFAANRDNRVTRELSALGLFRHEPENHLDFVLEGGAIDCDGDGTILTTSECLLGPNRNPTLSKEEIEEKLCATLGAGRILWLDHGALEGDDTDSHIDTLARFLPPGDTIAFTGCADPSDAHHTALSKMREQLAALRRENGMPYHLLELPLPDPVHHPDDGHRLPATYANFLILNNTVLLPVYNQPLKDKMAADILAAAMPQYTIIPVDCRALVRQHGSLHCATMQIPDNTLSI